MKFLPGEEEITYHLARGIIAGVSGHPMSGLSELHFMNGKKVYLDMRGIRVLGGFYGIFDGTANPQDKIRGQDIYYSVDPFGILETFAPAKKWKGLQLEVGEEVWLPESGFLRNKT